MGEYPDLAIAYADYSCHHTHLSGHFRWTELWGILFFKFFAIPAADFAAAAISGCTLLSAVSYTIWLNLI
jgi:hypothetical protein